MIYIGYIWLTKKIKIDSLVKINLFQTILLLITLFLVQLFFSELISDKILNFVLPNFKISDAFPLEITSLISAIIIAPLLEEYVFRYSLTKNKTLKVFSFYLLLILSIYILISFIDKINSKNILNLIVPIVTLVFLPAIFYEMLNICEVLIEKNFGFLKFGKEIHHKIIPKNKPIKRMLKIPIWLEKTIDKISNLDVYCERYASMIINIFEKQKTLIICLSIFFFAIGHYTRFVSNNSVIQFIIVLLFYVPFATLLSFVAMKFKNGVFIAIISHAIWNTYCYKDVLANLIINIF